jgi:hypothetical protein
MEFSPDDFRPYSRSFARFLLPFALLLLIPPFAWPPQVPTKVDIHVYADQSQGELSPIWNYFGYDEPNYTYAVNGRSCWANWRPWVQSRLMFASTTC